MRVEVPTKAVGAACEQMGFPKYFERTYAAGPIIAQVLRNPIMESVQYGLPVGIRSEDGFRIMATVQSASSIVPDIYPAKAELYRVTIGDSDNKAVRELIWIWNGRTHIIDKVFEERRITLPISVKDKKLTVSMRAQNEYTEEEALDIEATGGSIGRAGLFQVIIEAENMEKRTIELGMDKVDGTLRYIVEIWKWDDEKKRVIPHRAKATKDDEAIYLLLHRYAAWRDASIWKLLANPTEYITS